MLTLLNLGESIAERRRSLGLTQSQLAERAGISRASLDALENGRARELGYNKVIKTLAVLGLGLAVQTEISRRPTLDELRAESVARGRQ